MLANLSEVVSGNINICIRCSATISDANDKFRIIYPKGSSIRRYSRSIISALSDHSRK
jgi:hypothetical protein